MPLLTGRAKPTPAPADQIDTVSNDSHLADEKKALPTLSEQEKHEEAVTTPSSLSETGEKQTLDEGKKGPAPTEATHKDGAGGGGGDDDDDGHLHRGLKSRQLTMIAIGGAIGTGLVIGTGTGLAHGGPASLFIGYTVMGIVCYGVLVALGEMAAFLPHRKGFAGHATRFVDPAYGFCVGIIYLCKYLIITPSQLNASALILAYWSSASPAIWVSVFLVLILLLNFAGVRWFGEIEFWLSFIKIVTLTGLIILGICIDFGASPTGDRIFFRNWREKPFAEYIERGALGRFLGFWSVFSTSLRVHGQRIGRSEVKNPRKAMPRAIRTTFIRICAFYILGVFVLGLIVPADDPRLLGANGRKANAAASPFVVAIQIAQIRVLPGIINGALLLFTLSASNSDLYIASRTLYNLAADGNAPAIFKRCDRRGVPYVSLAFCAMFCGLAYLNVSSGGAQTFKYFTSAVTIFGGLTWIGITSSQIRFRRALKAQGISPSSLPYEAPFQPYLSWFSVSFTTIVLIFKGFDSFTPRFDYKNFITNYFGIPIFFLAYFGYKFIRKTRIVPLNDVDLQTGVNAYDGMEEDDEEDTDTEKYRSLTMKQKAVHYIKNW
ncbi:amino acid transporter [Tilletia horrida]|nr:amino acid transporter [Tilletia horrida]